jgi:hypothetical protein
LPFLTTVDPSPLLLVCVGMLATGASSRESSDSTRWFAPSSAINMADPTGNMKLELSRFRMRGSRSVVLLLAGPTNTHLLWTARLVRAARTVRVGSPDYTMLPRAAGTVQGSGLPAEGSRLGRLDYPSTYPSTSAAEKWVACPVGTTSSRMFRCLLARSSARGSTACEIVPYTLQS